jgi:hypothetical protein
MFPDDNHRASDTGSLAGDVEAMLTSMLEWFEAPLTARIFPDLVAEGQRDPKLRVLLHAGVRDKRRATADEILQRAVIVTQGDTSATYVRTLAAALLRAIHGDRSIS